MSTTITRAARGRDPRHPQHGSEHGPDRRSLLRPALRPALALGALGIVFGDIGTSPIYTLQTVFSPTDPHPVPQSTEAVYGVVSAVIWSVMLIVTLTYVVLAMRVSHDGEGGIMALITLLRRRAARHPSRALTVLAALGVLGAALFLGDSMITPAISVLSAVEGLRVVDPGFGSWIVPITAVILTLLFLGQRFGSAVVGRLFGPVMLCWFAVIGACGVRGILLEPGIVRALSPHYAIGFMVGHPGVAFFSLAAIVLAVTGAEALYADMGHFGRSPITLGWLAVVMPACVLSYLGQGALVIDDPSTASAPFFLLIPRPVLIPVVLLATAATVIASQAVITGAFSVAAQAARLGYLPRLRIVHTSRSTRGQVYVPWINWLLFVAVVTLVFAFRSSASLAFAFGMAVTGTITITTVLFFAVARPSWRGPGWLWWLGAAPLLLVDLLFVAANLTKLVHGAWLPLLIGLLAFTVMTTWQRGRELVTRRRIGLEGPLRDFVDGVTGPGSGVRTVEGTAVFLNRGCETAPLALRANVEHNHVRHRWLVLVAVETAATPRVEDADRWRVHDLGHTADGVLHLTLRFGWTETPDVPAALARLGDAVVGPDFDSATYFLSTMELVPGERPLMPRWRRRIFLATSAVTADAAEHFGLPRERTVLLGSQVAV